MNQPDRVAAWLVDEENGEKPMEITEDPKLPGSIKVVLTAQDHTLGNMLRSQLLLDPHVIFAGYRIPHPLQNKVEIRIQTDQNMQPYVSPRKALLKACADLVNQGRDLKQQFLDQARAIEITGGAALTGMARLGGYGDLNQGPAGGDAYASLGSGAYDPYAGTQQTAGAGSASQAVDDPYGY